MVSTAAALSALALGSAARAQIAAATAAAEAPVAAPPAALPVAAAAAEPPPGIEPQPAYPYGPPPQYPPPPEYAPPPPEYAPPRAYAPPPPAYAPPPYGYDSPYYNPYYRYDYPYYRPYRRHYRAMPYGYPTAAESMAGFHTHDGFFMRVHLGIAATSLSSTTMGTKTSFSGGGSSMGIAIGGAICRNLILYATVFGTNTVNPEVKVGGVSQPAGPVGSISVAAIGPGLAYYFEQTNIYLSGAFGLAGYQMHDVNDGSKINWSRSGSALELMIGKEWWASRDWGLGIAAELIAGSMKDAATPGLIWSAGSGAILFSATYN
jgi:hypothetical protein